MDLNGEALEAYSSQSSPWRHRDMDEVDELKAAVVMETIMTAADVAHNLQGWDQVSLFADYYHYYLFTHLVWSPRFSLQSLSFDYFAMMIDGHLVRTPVL